MNKKRDMAEPLYLQLYEYYKNLIELGRMKAGEKLPSIRRCALERQVSKTTVEASYMQLCAEGYIEAVAGSGYYVSEVGFEQVEKAAMPYQAETKQQPVILYDFASSGVDDRSFNFDLWRRYMKSALRNTKRLVAYGDPQGEYDLRVALGNYVKEARGVVCSPEQIVIGAGIQSLLSILCTLIPERKTVCFTGNGFKQGKAIFEDRGFDTYYKQELASKFDYFKENGIKTLYVSPSHSNVLGETMSMKTRVALLRFAAKEDCLIIEDDYDSEFRYYTRPVPSLQSLDGGQKVVYIGSFSRMLMPSLRISFMVLPVELMPLYQQRGALYNQTASTAEQIALCQFVRDGHLKKQIKKARKIYMNKSQQLCLCIKKIFKEQAKGVSAADGFMVKMEVESKYSTEELVKKAQAVGVNLKIGPKNPATNKTCFLLSCSAVDENDFEPAMLLLKECFS